MRHLFIINPAAGKRKSTKELENLIARLTFPHQVVYTTGEGDAQRITEQAVSDPTPIRIYACGGDGTLNEVVNGAAGHDHVAVTNVPKGTGNDFLRIFGQEYRSIFYDLEGLATGPQTPMDLMDCNGKLGIDVVCAGVDARVAASVHRYKGLWFLTGFGAYTLSLVEHIFLKGINRPMSAHMGEITQVNCPTAILCICNGRYYGGGFMPVGEAMPDDGVLDMLLVPEIRLPKFLRLLKKYATGRYYECTGIVHDYHGQEVTFSSEEPITVVVDGEVMVEKSFTVRLSEKKVNFFYPEGASYQTNVQYASASGQNMAKEPVAR